MSFLLVYDSCTFLPAVTFSKDHVTGSFLTQYIYCPLDLPTVPYFHSVSCILFLWSLSDIFLVIWRSKRGGDARFPSSIQIRHFFDFRLDTTSSKFCLLFLTLTFQFTFKWVLTWDRGNGRDEVLIILVRFLTS